MKSVTRYRPLLLALAFTSLVGLGPRSWAGPDGGPGGAFGHDLFSAERLASELGLTDAQRSAVDQLMDRTREQARPYVRTLMAQHKAMRALSEAETFDEAAARNQAAQGAAAMTELALIRARSGFELRKLLSPAQRDQLNSMHAHHRRRSARD